LYFKLPRPARLKIEHCDAADWVADPEQQGSCAVLMVDIYDGQARGPVRDSLEFYQDCRAVLSEVGVLTVNLFGAHASFERNIRNLSQAFDGRLLSLPQIDAGNQIVLAFKGPKLEVSIDRLLARAEDVEKQYGLPAKKWARSMLGRAEHAMLVI
jgi:spermidine synthase